MISTTVRKVVLYQSNTQTVEFVGMQNNLTGVYINDATVNATLVDQSGNSVPGCIGVPLTASGAGGNYVGVLGDNTFNPDVGDGYLLKVDASQGTAPTIYGHWEFPTEIRARRQ